MVIIMAIVPDVKCKKCDRRFSGLLSRCPYCHARRGTRGKYAEGDRSFKSNMMVGILILAALVIAVAVLLVTSLAERGNSGDPDSDTSNNPLATGGDPSQNSPLLPDDGDVTMLPGPTTTPTPTEPPITDIDPPPSSVESVQVTYLGSPPNGNEFSLRIGEVVPLKVRTVPAETEFTPVWESSNDNVFMVNSSGSEANVTGTGAGNATLTVTVGDATYECIVRCHT
jgi:hypothetical protein